MKCQEEPCPCDYVVTEKSKHTVKQCMCFCASYVKSDLLLFSFMIEIEEYSWLIKYHIPSARCCVDLFQ